MSIIFVFCKQKTAYEMRISDWSSDVCSSDLARGLIARGYTSAGKISIEGRSAGGQVVGAVVNEAPDLWGAVLAGVPFVDVINTMIDEDLPLTPGEWPEWGNPVTDKAAFAYILSYSPYANATARAYPPMLRSEAHTS